VKSLLFRIGTLESGGAERVLINLLKKLDRTRYTITLLVESSGGVLEASIPSDIKVIRLFKGNAALGSKKKLYRLLYKIYRRISIEIIRTFPELLYLTRRLTRYDIEISFLQDITPYAIPLLVNPNKSAKKIAWIHTDMRRTDYSNKRRSKIIKGLRKYDKVVAVSQRVKESLAILDSSLTTKTFIVPNIVLKNEIIDKAAAPVNFTSNGSTTLAFLGRLEKVKGIDRLLSCLAKLSDEGLSFQLLILGDGSERQNIENLIRSLGLDGKIIRLGYKSNPYPYLKASDIFVLSSYYEGYPMVVTEALVLGKAVIATDVSGIAEILNGGEFGLIVENNEAALGEGLRKMLSDEHTRSHYAKQAIRGSERFSAETILLQLDEIFSFKS